MASINLEGITKRFGTDVIAVDDVSLDIEDGEFMVLVGPSGCGKSTILRIVAGLEEVTAGEVRIGDDFVTDLPAKARDVAMVFQNYALFPHMNVAQNIGFGLQLRKVSKDERKERVKQTAETLGLGALLERKPAELSGGQLQRVAMGRAMIRQPKAFLMDEPLSNLDAKLRVQMRAELASIHQRTQTTAIYVTHDQVEAMTLGDRVAVLNEGVLQQVDTPKALYDSPKNLFVAAFMGSPSMNLVHARIEPPNVVFGRHSLPLPASFPSASHDDVILGIRPPDLVLTLDSAEPCIEAETLMIEELGSETHVLFKVDAPAVSTEVTAAAATDEGEELEPSLLMGGEGSTSFTAQLDARSSIRKGESIRLVPERDSLYFFDPKTSESITY